MNLKGKRVLITGGNGYLGKNLCKKLKRLNAKVFIMDLIVDKKDQKQFKCDMKNRSSLKKIIDKIKPHFVVHLAANTNHERRIELFELMMSDNFLTTLNLFISLLNSKSLKCVINTGSCEEYGNIRAPFKESEREKPVSPYSLSKVSTTHLSRIFFEEYNLPVITIRPFLFYGPKQSANLLIPSFINAIKNGYSEFKSTAGGQTREYNYITDVVDGYIACLMNYNRLLGEVLNLGNGNEYKIRYVLKFIKKLTNSNIKIKFGSLKKRKGEAAHFYSNNRLLKNKTNWKPKITLEDGLKKTIKDVPKNNFTCNN